MHIYENQFSKPTNSLQWDNLFAVGGDPCPVTPRDDLLVTEWLQIQYEMTRSFHHTLLQSLLGIDRWMEYPNPIQSASHIVASTS